MKRGRIDTRAPRARVSPVGREPRLPWMIAVRVIRDRAQWKRDHERQRAFEQEVAEQDANQLTDR